MRLIKFSLAMASAVFILGALASTAAAGRLSFSATRLRTTWSRWDFRGGFGTVECELVLESNLHARTLTKTVGALVGYITAGSITRCATGGRTILRKTLPWHVTYAAFTGTLPNITTMSTLIHGFSFSMREPTFGVTCLARGTATFVYGLAAGVVTSASMSGTMSCAPTAGTVGGSTTNVDNGAGARVTVTLI